MLGKANVKLNVQKANLSLFIVSADYSALMGMSWLRELQLDWTKVHAVSAKKESAVLKRHQSISRDELGSIKEIKVTLQMKPDHQPKLLKAGSAAYALNHHREPAGIRSYCACL